MKRRYRLRHSADITLVYRSGRRCKHPLAILVFRPNALPSLRFAFVAGKRVGNAVLRNRAKRLLREAARLHLDQLDGGWDCVFVARQATPTATFDDVNAAVAQLLRRAGLVQRSDGALDGKSMSSGRAEGYDE